jgi:hypothetical protein
MGFIQPSLRDFGNAKLFPALKRRAIFKFPDGTKRAVNSLRRQPDNFAWLWQ